MPKHWIEHEHKLVKANQKHHRLLPKQLPFDEWQDWTAPGIRIVCTDAQEGSGARMVLRKLLNLAWSVKGGQVNTHCGCGRDVSWALASICKYDVLARAGPSLDSCPQLSLQAQDKLTC